MGKRRGGAEGRWKERGREEKRRAEEQRKSEKRRAKEGELVSYEGPTLIEKFMLAVPYSNYVLINDHGKCLEVVLFTCLYFAFCCF